MVFLLESLFSFIIARAPALVKKKHARKDEKIKVRKPFYKSASARRKQK